MRFVQFRLLDDSQQTIRVGIYNKDNGNVLDLTSALQQPNAGPINMVNALAKLGSQGVMHTAASSMETQLNQELDKSKYQLLAPITSPDKVACIGMNYKDHCQEQGVPIPKEPLVFSKFPSCIVGPFDNIPSPADLSEELDWEAELAVVIGKKGKNIDASLAKDYIFGYTVAHDVSARDWQLRKNGGQWLLGKAMDGFCPIGPCIVTADEIPDPHNLALSCTVNGQVKQNSTTAQLVHGVYDCVAWLSKFCTLQPGDIILTGTPPGVGAFAKPPLFLKKGDVVECEVENIGIIRNQVV
ncbi:fumarylacetoacetate hydrolase domain-containing protein 2-like isoform X2 [Daphnia carinata]|uniref:fumarylacetoacetate hydrolase domain-containing protein 2-like isoform X2 n=1 Tax=Daphnia carinata TaxID=120202 RepID=UPI0028697D09|nr:fumarylacetoacetate hydrolase domain-containing protein 2-like isoform X2 [Daphnia carinata]